jgi:hypothetical protein
MHLRVLLLALVMQLSARQFASCCCKLLRLHCAKLRPVLQLCCCLRTLLSLQQLLKLL